MNCTIYIIKQNQGNDQLHDYRAADLRLCFCNRVSHDAAHFGCSVSFQYIKNHFQTINWHIEEDSFQDRTPYGTKTFTNLIITHNPHAPKKLVLACHYDSKNITNGKGNFLIAATDSAVPCAILMDVAKKLDCSLRMDRKLVNDLIKRNINGVQHCIS